MLQVGELIRGVLVPNVPQNEIHDVDCRLYGGFSDRRGGPTEQYSRTLRKLKYLTSLDRRVRIRPHIARSLAPWPNFLFNGTYKNSKQKMVDHMLALDAVYFAESGDYDCLCVIANDDDYVPAIFSVGNRDNLPVRWLRKRITAENDHLFDGLKVTMLSDRGWQ